MATANGTDGAQPPHRITLLLEEWKKNVDLYIDQDKRGFQRINVFLLLHAGLLVVFGGFATVAEKYPALLIPVALLVPSVAVAMTIMTKRMCTQAHAFILLRKTQAMLIERAIAHLLNPEEKTCWKTDKGMITTFTREHVAFLDRFQEGVDIDQAAPKPQGRPEWQTLKQEMAELGPFAFAPFRGFWIDNQGTVGTEDHPTLNQFWRRSIGHLAWLRQLLDVLCWFWVGIAVIAIIFAATCLL